MNTLVINPFTISAIISLVLMVLLVGEVYNKYPYRNIESNNEENNKNASDEDGYKDDYLDFSGGTFGIE